MLGSILLIICIGVGYLTWIDSRWSAFREELSAFESDTSAKYLSDDGKCEIFFDENDMPIFTIHGEHDIVYDLQIFARSDGYFVLTGEIDG